MEEALKEINSVLESAGFNLGGPLGEWKAGRITVDLESAKNMCLAFEEYMKAIAQITKKALQPNGEVDGQEKGEI